MPMRLACVLPRNAIITHSNLLRRKTHDRAGWSSVVVVASSQSPSLWSIAELIIVSMPGCARGPLADA